MTHKITCFIGLHGSGKTTIGRALASHPGHQHISVGDLARMARRGRAPKDIPTRLLTSLSRHNAGSILTHPASHLLSEYLVHLAMRHSVSVDGFPADPAHLCLLPASIELWHFTVSDSSVRMQRLEKRSSETSRQWIAGLESQRDNAIASILAEAANSGVRIFDVMNDSDIPTTVARCREQLATA